MIEALFFTQDGCAPCLRVKPDFYALKDKFSSVAFLEIDIREGDNKIYADQMGVIGTPDIVVLKDGKFLERFNSRELTGGAFEDYLVQLTAVVIVDGGGPPVTNPPATNNNYAGLLWFGLAFLIAKKIL